MSHIVMPAIGALWALLLFGAGVAPSFLLVGWPLYRAVRHLGWTGPLVGGLTLAGTGLVVVSYLAVDWREPWGWLWGIEGPVLAAIGLASAGAGVTAWRRGAPRRWATMLIAPP